MATKPKIAVLGAGIQMSPNAVRVLRALDLEPYLRRVAFQPRSWRNRALASRSTTIRNGGGRTATS
jgi:6-hydroxynicotinate 3-monooxygenase